MAVYRVGLSGTMEWTPIRETAGVLAGWLATNEDESEYATSLSKYRTTYSRRYDVPEGWITEATNPCSESAVLFWPGATAPAAATTRSVPMKDAGSCAWDRPGAGTFSPSVGSR